MKIDIRSLCDYSEENSHRRKSNGIKNEHPIKVKQKRLWKSAFKKNGQ